MTKVTRILGFLFLISIPFQLMTALFVADFTFVWSSLVSLFSGGFLIATTEAIEDHRAERESQRKARETTPLKSV